MQSSSEHPAGLGGELRDNAQGLAGAAADRLHDEADRRKSPVVEQARSLSSALDRAGRELSGDQGSNWLGTAIQQGARQIQQLADSVERKGSRELLDDVRQLARNNPGTFLAACAAAGFAAGRILKAEPPRNASSFGSDSGSTSTPDLPASSAWPNAAGVGAVP